MGGARDEHDARQIPGGGIGVERLRQSVDDAEFDGLQPGVVIPVDAVEPAIAAHLRQRVQEFAMTVRQTGAVHPRGVLGRGCGERMDHREQGGVHAAEQPDDGVARILAVIDTP